MLIVRLFAHAAAWTGAGTVLALFANATLGQPSNQILASMLGAAIGSTIGWTTCHRHIQSLVGE